MCLPSKNALLLRVPVLLHLVIQAVQHGTDLFPAALVVLDELGQVHVKGRVLLQKARLVRILLHRLVPALCVGVDLDRAQDPVHHRHIVDRPGLNGRPHGHGVCRGVQQRLGDVFGVVVQALRQAGQQLRVPIGTGKYCVLRPFQARLGQHPRRRGHAAPVRRRDHLLDKLVDKGPVGLIVDGPLVVGDDQIQDVAHSGRVRHGLLRGGIGRRGGCVQLLGQPRPVLHLLGHAHQHRPLRQVGGVQAVPPAPLPHEPFILRCPAAVVGRDDGLGSGVPADHCAVPPNDGGAVLGRRTVCQQAGVQSPAHFLDLQLACRPAPVPGLQLRRVCLVHSAILVVGHHQRLRRHNGIGKADGGVPLGVGFVLVPQHHVAPLGKGIILLFRLLVHRKADVRVLPVKGPAVCHGAFHLARLKHRIGSGIALSGHDAVIAVPAQEARRRRRIDNLPHLLRLPGLVPHGPPFRLRDAGSLRQVRRRLVEGGVHLAHVRRVLCVEVGGDQPRPAGVDLRRRQRPLQPPGPGGVGPGVCRVWREPYGPPAGVEGGKASAGAVEYQQRPARRVLDPAACEPAPECLGLRHGLCPLDPPLQVRVLPQRRLG